MDHYQYSEEGARKYAENGMRFLDNGSRNWPLSVVYDLLDQASPHNCVLAHITSGTYTYGIKVLGVEDPVELGFIVPGESSDLRVINQYVWLTKFFKKGIKRRLEKVE